MMRRLRNDRGALINALVFVTVGFMLTGMMTAWLVSRVQADWQTAANARAASAINAYADILVAHVNASGVAEAFKNPPYGDFNELKATVTITKTQTLANGRILIDLKASSDTTRAPASLTSQISISPVSIAEYRGDDAATKRPLWTSSSAGKLSLALYVIDPPGGTS